MYHMEYKGQPLVSLGLIIGLDYKNPYTNLYQVLAVKHVKTFTNHFQQI